MRYSKEFKLECVRRYRNGEHIDDPKGCAHTTFRHKVVQWSHIYDQMGEAGLDHGKPKLGLPEKLALIRRIEDGESINSVALSAGRPEQLLSRWYKIYLQDGEDGLKSHHRRGRPPKMKDEPIKEGKESAPEETKRERDKELEELRLENEYLKKLLALVQARRGRQRKRRRP